MTVDNTAYQEFSYTGQRGPYGRLKTDFALTHGPQSFGPGSDSLKAPILQNVGDPVASRMDQLKKDIQGADTPEKQVKFAMEALREVKDQNLSPAIARQMTMKVMATALGAAGSGDAANSKTGRANMIGAFMQEKDFAAATVNLLIDKPELGDLKGAHLENVSLKNVEALPFNLLNVREAHLPTGANLSNNQYMDNANFDGTTAALLTVPRNVAGFSAKNANMRQNPAVTEEEAHNIAVLNLAGAKTGPSQVLTNGVGTTLSLQQVTVAAPGIEGVKEGLKPIPQKQAENKMWAGHLGISSMPSPPA